MNSSLTIWLVLAASSLSAVCSAQTPASNPSGSYQPLSPHAVTVYIDGRHAVAANVVGQRVTASGTFYDIDTRKGRRVVSAAALLGLPCLPVPVPRSERHYTLPANVHRFR